MTKSPEELIYLYKTHVLLDISLGGRLLFNYTANISNETTTLKKTSKVEGGLGFFVKKFGINFKTSKTTDELKTNFNESRERQMYLKFYGGLGSGRTVNYDSEGYTSESVNISSWQQSITDRNCGLIDIERMVPLYEFIDDPVKKAQVKAAIEKHIKDNQITELGEVPVYVYNNKKTTDHYFSTQNEPSISGGQYINEGIVFYAFKEQKQGTVPVYTYFSKSQSAHYLSTSNQPSIKGSYLNEGIIFYAYNQLGDRRAPVYAYSGVYGGDYYFTTENQPTLGNGGYRNEGIIFYGVNTD